VWKHELLSHHARHVFIPLACLLIAAVDGKNNARHMGGDSFEVEIVGPGNTTPKAEIQDNNDGYGATTPSLQQIILSLSVSHHGATLWTFKTRQRPCRWLNEQNRAEHALPLCRTYTVYWSTEKTGDYLITGWLEGCTVGGCAKACSVQPAALDAAQCSCSCYGDGMSRVEAGVPASFTVTARDRCAGWPILLPVCSAGKDMGAG
jgi:hypothetical protein